MRDESKRAPVSYENSIDEYCRNNVSYRETTGDTHDTPCPWCGEILNLNDDAAYECAQYECEHCGADVELAVEYSVTVTAVVRD